MAEDITIIHKNFGIGFIDDKARRVERLTLLSDMDRLDVFRALREELEVGLDKDSQRSLIVGVSDKNPKDDFRYVIGRITLAKEILNIAERSREDLKRIVGE